VADIVVAMTIDVDDRLRGVLAAVPEVAAAYLFGSHAHGRARPNSDVDVAVIFAADSDRGTRFRLRCVLSERLARASGTTRADVVDLEMASALLAHEVLRGGRLLLSRDDPRRTRVIARQTMRYIDGKPMRRVLDEATFRRLLEGTFGRLS
jgi:predicted nucleotidyltransferase